MKVTGWDRHSLSFMRPDGDSLHRSERSYVGNTSGSRHVWVRNSFANSPFLECGERVTDIREKQGTIIVARRTETTADTNISDSEYLAAIARAKISPADFEPLYRAHAPEIYRYCHRQLGDADHAADAASQVFSKVLSAIESFSPDPHSPRKTLRAWLFRIASNVVIDTRRAQRPQQPLDAEPFQMLLPATGFLPEEIVLREEQARTVRTAIATLPPRQRAIIELRLADLSSHEIADVMNISLSALKSAQFRAFTTLRQALAALDTEHRGVPR
jgi:RNA polymerase sigma-70 factor (ECF subfamily)